MFVEVLFSFEGLEIIFLNCSLKTGYYIKNMIFLLMSQFHLLWLRERKDKK